MPSIKCKVCGNSFYGTTCPRCGVNAETWLPNTSIPPFRWVLVITATVFLVFGFIGIAVKYIFGGMFLILLGGFLLISQVTIMRREKELYELAKTDYKKFVLQMRSDFPYIGDPLSEKSKRLISEAQQSALAHIPACPVCGSKLHIKRITGLDRTVSTAVLGLASSSIGKQWECVSCKHKF